MQYELHTRVLIYIRTTILHKDSV